MTAPPLAIELPDGSRAYVNPRTGEQAPSVTSILREGLGKPRITAAATRIAAEYADTNWAELTLLPSWNRIDLIRHAHDREWGKAADLGTSVHRAIECWIKGKPCEYVKEVDPYMTSFTKFLMEKRSCFLASELTVWSRKHNYAGTADALISLGNETWMVDWKTGKNLYPEVALQLSALSNADFIIHPDGTEEEMPVIDAVAAVHVRPRSWKFVPIGCPGENFQAFLAIRQLYRWSKETAPTVLRMAA